MTEEAAMRYFVFACMLLVGACSTLPAAPPPEDRRPGWIFIPAPGGKKSMPLQCAIGAYVPGCIQEV